MGKSVKKELESKIINAENQLEDIRRNYYESENEKEYLKQGNKELESNLKKLNEDYEKLSTSIKDQSSNNVENLNFISVTSNLLSDVHEDLQIQIMTKKMDEREKLKDDYTTVVKEQKELKNNYENLKVMSDMKLEELKQIKLEHEEQVNMYSNDILKKEEEFRETEKVISKNKDIYK